MYQAIGLETKKIYMVGSREDCSKMLNSFPSYDLENAEGKGGIPTFKKVLPEPIKIKRR